MRKASSRSLYNSRFSRSAPPWNQNASTPSPTGLPTLPCAAANCGGIFDFDAKQAKLEEITKGLEDPDIWSDAERAQALGKERKALEGVVLTLRDVDQRLKDTEELFELARGEDDDATVAAV